MDPAQVAKIHLLLFDTNLNMWRSALCPGTSPVLLGKNSIQFEVCHFTLFIPVVPVPVVDRDPLLEWSFRMICEHHVDTYFTQISGIKNANECNSVVNFNLIWTGECERFTTVNGREVTSCLPSQLVVSPLTFQKIVTLDHQVWDWRDLVSNGRLTEARNDCGIIMYDRAYRPVIVYYLYNAWPASVRYQ